MSKQCRDCKLTFNDVALSNNKPYTATEQFNFHKIKGKCAQFEFGSVHYLFFSNVYKDRIVPKVEGLSDEIGNVLFVYTGESEHGGLVRAMNQPLKLHYNYHKEDNDSSKDTKLMEVYKRTVLSKGNRGLYMMIVRSSEGNYNEIASSEFCMIERHREDRCLGDYLIYNQKSGNNLQGLDLEGQKEMHRANYRIIEWKIKNGLYIQITKEMLDNLIKPVLNGGIGDAAYRLCGTGGGTLGLRNINSNQLENLYNQLYKSNPEFFIPGQQAKTQSKGQNSSDSSFFERRLDTASWTHLAFKYYTKALSEEESKYLIENCPDIDTFIY